MSMSVDGTTTVDGDEVLRLSIDSINRSSDMLSIGAGLENARGYALVTSEGVIRELHWKATNSTTGATESMTVTVSEVGETSVERPDWTTGYPDATVSTTSEGRVLTLTHQGDATIEAGTRIKLGTRRLPYGNVTLPESFESGETLYVVASGQFGNYDFTASVGSQPTVSENATSFSRLPPVSVSLDGATLRYGPEVGARAGTSSGFGAGA